MRGLTKAWVLLATFLAISARSGTAATILIHPEGWETDAGFRLALDDLQEAGRRHGLELSPVPASRLAGQGVPPGSLLVGPDNPVIDRWNQEGRLDLPPLDADDHLVQSVPVDGGRALVVIGGSLRGSLYGLFFVARQVAIDPEKTWSSTTLRRPAFDLRLASGETPEQALRLGYNAICLNDAGITGEATLSADLHDWEPSVQVPDGPLARACDRHRATLETLIERVSSLHLAYYGQGQEPEGPAELLASPRAPSLTHAGDPADLCLARPATWQFLAAKYRTARPLLSRMKGYIVRAATRTERTTDGLFVATPAWTIPGNQAPALLAADCPPCERTGYEERVVDLIRSLRAMVRRQGVEQFIYQAAQPSSVLMHANPDLYRRIVARLKDTEGLWIALRATRTGFWNYADPNPCLGLGKVAQIIEFDCERRDEGHGAFPAFIGARAARTYALCRARGIRAIWNHHRSLVDGPRPAIDLWRRANAYVASQLLWDPDDDPRRLAREWAALEVAPGARDALAELLALSERAAPKWRYVEPYSRQRLSYRPAAGLVRADALGGQPTLETIWATARHDIDRIIEEKDSALELIAAMRERLESCRQAIDTSPIAGRTLRYELRPPPDPAEPLAFARLLTSGEASASSSSGAAGTGRIAPSACRPVPYRLAARLPTDREARYALRLIYERASNGSTVTIRPPELQDRLLEVSSSVAPDAPPALAYHHYRRDDFDLRLLFQSPPRVVAGTEAWATVTLISMNALDGNDRIEPRLTAIDHQSGKVIDLDLQVMGRVDASLFNSMEASIEHLQSLTRLLRSALAAYLLERRGRHHDDAEDQGQALASALDFNHELEHYRDDLSRLSGAPGQLDCRALEEAIDQAQDRLERAVPASGGPATLDVLAAAGREDDGTRWCRQIDERVLEAGRLGRLRRAGLRDQAAELAYRRRVARAFKSLTGGLPQRTPLDHEQRDTIQETGFHIRRVLFQSRPGLYVTANVYEPDGLTRRPAIVLCCDRDPAGKAAPEVQTLATALVRRGYVVAVPDPLGLGERRETYDPRMARALLDDPHLEQSIVALGWELVGWRLERLSAWDVIRTVDFACTLSTVDHERVAVIGLGKGALCATDAALIDERIGTTILLSPPAGLADDLAGGLADDPLAAMAGALRAGAPVDWPDRLLALAPRRAWALLTEQPVNGDPRLGITALSTLRERLGRTDLWHVVELATASPLEPATRAAVFAALVESFGRTPEPLQDLERVERQPRELSGTPTGQVASSVPSRTTARAYAAHQAAVLRRQRHDAAQLPRPERISRLMAVAGVARPESSVKITTISSTRRDELRLERVVIDGPDGQPLPAVLILPVTGDDAASRPATIYLTDQGKALAAAPGGAAELLARRGRVVLALDVRGVGELAPDFGSQADLAGGYQALIEGTRAVLARRTQLLGQSLPGLQAADILAAISGLRERAEISPEAISIDAIGDLTVPATLATVIDEGVAALTLEGGLVSYESVLQAELFEVSPALFIPDLLRFEDLPDILGLVAPRPLQVIAPIDARRRLLDPTELDEILAVTFSAYGHADADKRIRIEPLPLSVREEPR